MRKLVLKLPNGKFYKDRGDSWPYETSNINYADDLSIWEHPMQVVYHPDSENGELVWFKCSNWVEVEKYKKRC
jgi:hypothetical protein